MEILLLNLLVFYIGAIFGNIYYNLKNYIINKDTKDKKTKETKKTKSKKVDKKCNRKKGLLANIPILSYIAFPEDCKACKINHVKPKLFSEILIGIIFCLSFNSLNLTNVFTSAEVLQTKMAILLKAGLMFSLPLTLGFIYLIGMVEKETHKININVLTYGLIVAAAIVCLKFIVNVPGVQYNKNDLIIAGVYILIIMAIYIMQLLTASKDPESKYVLDIVLIVFILTSFFGSVIMINTIILTIITIIIGYIFGVFNTYEYKENILLKKEDGKIKTRTESAFVKNPKYIPYSLIIGSISIFVLIMNNFLQLANILI